jgi:metal-dependent amidase/aminoacylase/carboxypeptidase family protein
VRSYSAESRKRLLDGIARIAAGEATAAGMPAEKMSVVTISPEAADATWNTPDLSERVAAHFRERFGAERVAEPTPSMAAEDFGVFAKADPERSSR